MAKKKPEDLTEAEKEQILADVDKELESMTADDVIKAVERGDIELEYVDAPNPIDNFTEENFKKFISAIWYNKLLVSKLSLNTSKDNLAAAIANPEYKVAIAPLALTLLEKFPREKQL